MLLLAPSRHSRSPTTCWPSLCSEHPHATTSLHCTPAAHDWPAKCPLLTTPRRTLITSIHPHPMYANAAIQFRDPFAARDSTINRQPHTYGQSRANWASYSNNQDLSRALTPPPDMNSVSHASQHAGRQEHGQHYNSHVSAHSTYRAPVASYSSYQPSANSNTAESKVSPTMQTRLPALDSANDSQSRPHKPNNNAIAPSFQIPKSVNDSGGSLSELAAEVSLCRSTSVLNEYTDLISDHMSFLV